MTIPNVGLAGAASSGTAGVGAYQPLTMLIKEHGFGRFSQTINMEAPLLDDGLLKQVKRKGTEWTITAHVGRQPSTCWIRDFQPLPRGTAPVPNKGRVLPTQVIDVISLGRAAADAEIEDGPDGVATMFETAIDDSAKNCAQHVSVGLYGVPAVPFASATWSGTAANSTVTVGFEDVSMFRVNMAVDWCDTSASLAYVVRVSAIDMAAVGSNTAAVAGNVTFTNDVLDRSTTSGAITTLGSTNVATADFFRLRGSTVGFGGSNAIVTNNPIISFNDIAGSGATTTLYGLDPAALAGWTGNFASLGGVYNQEFFLARRAIMKNRGSKMLNRCVMNPLVAAAHGASTGQQANTFGMTAGVSSQYQIQMDRSRDKYGDPEKSNYRLGGTKIAEDSNCPSTVVVMWDYDTTYLGVSKKISPDEEAGDPVLLGRDLNNIEVQVRGEMQLLCEDRKSVLFVSGIQGL